MPTSLHPLVYWPTFLLLLPDELLEKFLGCQKRIISQADCIIWDVNI